MYGSKFSCIGYLTYLHFSAKVFREWLSVMYDCVIEIGNSILLLVLVFLFLPCVLGSWNSDRDWVLEASQLYGCQVSNKMREHRCHRVSFHFSCLVKEWTKGDIISYWIPITSKGIITFLIFVLMFRYYSTLLVLLNSPNIHNLFQILGFLFLIWILWNYISTKFSKLEKV